MAKGKVYISAQPDDLPEWYWGYGLHDACIVGVEEKRFPFNYDKYVADNYRYDRNVLIFKIDAKTALGNFDVTEIRFYNYKVLTDDIQLKGREEVWWLADRLVDHGDYYTVEWDMQDLDSKSQDFTYQIKFERAEVDRSSKPCGKYVKKVSL